MKIEFCCEEMLLDYFVRQETCVFELCNDSPKGIGKWGVYYINKQYELKDTCPYCGAKIEITVKDKK